eukprot:11303615-Karenia_brevis.AAC.1
MVSTDSGGGVSQIVRTTKSAATCGLSRQEALASLQSMSGCAVRFNLSLLPQHSRRPESPKHTVSG